jgi:thiol-disulfide isomerase/thioredoxin
VKNVNGQRSTVNGKILAAVILLFSLGTAQPLRAQFEAGIPVGTVAPAVTINDMDGKPVDLGLVLGKKPVLIEFWATWCSLCKALLPQLEAVHKTYGDRVELIGVNVTVNDSKSRVVRYQAEHKPPFKVLYDEKGVGARAFDVPGTSYIVVVDRGGKVVYTGSGDRQDLVKAVAKAFQVP